MFVEQPLVSNRPPYKGITIWSSWLLFFHYSNTSLRVVYFGRWKWVVLISLIGWNELPLCKSMSLYTSTRTTRMGEPPPVSLLFWSRGCLVNDVNCWIPLIFPKMDKEFVCVFVMTIYIKCTSVDANMLWNSVFWNIYTALNYIALSCVALHCIVVPCIA